LILEGQCFQTESALPYAPLLDLFRSFFAIHSSGEITHVMESSAPQLIKLFPELAVHLPHLTPVSSPDPKQEKQRLFQALMQPMTQLAQIQPLIVVIEDLHWSDSTSLEFLLQLARRISTQPILLIATYRSEEVTPELTHFLSELNRARLGTEITLKPMNAGEVDAMLRAILELQGPVTPEFLDIIFPPDRGQSILHRRNPKDSDCRVGYFLCQREMGSKGDQSITRASNNSGCSTETNAATGRKNTSGVDAGICPGTAV
jgi:predicted ATPase